MNRKEKIVKKLFVFLAAVALIAGFSSASIAGIQGSLHDFSIYDWSNQQICLPCHTPHNALDVGDNAPLWNHELSQETYNLYSSPTLQAVVGQPTGGAKLCLSCHDGTLSLDAFGGDFGTGIKISAVNASADLTTDLSNDHPISFVYDDALAGQDPGLNFPSTTTVDIGTAPFNKTGTIADVLLEGGTVLQCQSCHSVHNDYVVGDMYLLKMDSNGSQHCLACHNK